MDSILYDVSDAVVVGRSGSDRLVCLPTGIFVVTLSDGVDVDRAAQHSKQLAIDARNELADYLRAVPFITPIVVSTRRDSIVPHIAASIVPINLLAATLEVGHRCLDHHALDNIRALFRSGVVDWELLELISAAA